MGGLGSHLSTGCSLEAKRDHALVSTIFYHETFTRRVRLGGKRLPAAKANRPLNVAGWQRNRFGNRSINVGLPQNRAVRLAKTRALGLIGFGGPFFRLPPFRDFLGQLAGFS